MDSVPSVMAIGSQRRRPRIALVSWHTSPLAAPGAGRAGGMNVYVRELARALNARGADVDILTHAPGAPGAHALAPGLRVITLPTDDRALAPLPRYDVVHSHYWQSAPIADALVARDHARHVHTFHTLGAVKNAALTPGDLPEPDHRLAAERELAARADALVVATKTERDQIRGLIGATAAIHVVAPGVDLARFSPSRVATIAGVRTRLGLDDGPLALHVGRIQPLKGIDLAVRALGQLAPELRRRCTLALAGGPSGPTGQAALAAVRREARRLAPRVSVRLLGRVDRRTLPVLLGVCDVAVVPSLSESFCLAALEAQACGVPVVGTAVGGLPQFVADGESGRLVAREPAALAAGLDAVLGVGVTARRQMHDAAVESARGYGWAATAAGVSAAYGL